MFSFTRTGIRIDQIIYFWIFHALALWFGHTDFMKNKLRDYAFQGRMGPSHQLGTVVQIEILLEDFACAMWYECLLLCRVASCGLLILWTLFNEVLVLVNTLQGLLDIWDLDNRCTVKSIWTGLFHSILNLESSIGPVDFSLTYHAIILDKRTTNAINYVASDTTQRI